MPIQKLLDLSTAHITSKDAEILREFGANGSSPSRTLIAYPYEYGWTISTALLNSASLPNPDPEENEDPISHVRGLGFSDAFVNLLRYAHGQGTVLIRLDADGDLEPGLPAFDWEHGDEPIETINEQVSLPDQPVVEAADHSPTL